MVIITSVLCIMGVVESERLSSRETYGNGDPSRTYVVNFPAGQEIDYGQLMAEWSGNWNFERFMLMIRGGTPVDLAVVDYRESSEGFPPLQEGRYFTRGEMASQAQEPNITTVANDLLQRAGLMPDVRVERIGELADEYTKHTQVPLRRQFALPPS